MCRSYPVVSTSNIVFIRIVCDKRHSAHPYDQTMLAEANEGKTKMNESVINVSGGTTRCEFIVLLDMPRIRIPHQIV